MAALVPFFKVISHGKQKRVKPFKKTKNSVFLKIKKEKKLAKSLLKNPSIWLLFSKFKATLIIKKNKMILNRLVNILFFIE